ncbi:MAG TPA: DUF2312 domain-containing protein [Alphaproteobacteria bacterium]|nr:DUF2312 domain-containing protein [Alphaproteobacteria bacterium]
MADGGTGGIAAAKLKSLVERIERLEGERSELGADIREVFSEAKGSGFDVKIMRQLIRLRRMDNAARQEQDELLELYRRALGM